MVERQLSGAGESRIALRRAAVGMCVALAVAAVPAHAEESPVKEPHGLLDTSPQERPQQLSFWIGAPFTYYYYGYSGLYGVSLGVRYAIPIVKNGFIPRLNNSFEVEFGGTIDLVNEYPYPLGWGIDIPAEFRWTFHITRAIAVYPKIALGIRLQFLGYYGCPGPYSYCQVLWPYYDAAVGAMFTVAKAVDLRVELGVQGLRLGVGLNL